MAARAIWQRSANRCFIREDAKRVPKLACCCSISSLISEIDTKFCNLNEKSFDSNLSSDSKWWIQSQPGYIFQMEDSQNSHQFVENYDGSSLNSSTRSYEFVEMDSVKLPLLSMSKKDDLGQIPSKRSHLLIESCDLDQPMHSGFDPQMIKTDRTAISGNELQDVTSKTRILEALCHSQTRARKAELAAKKALAEKDHAIKILMKQRSQLFAYEQWIHLLQLENLCYQIKNNKNTDPISPSENCDSNKNLKKLAPAKGKRKQVQRRFGRFELDLGKFAVVYALGLGIVGAGLVLGWTVGWLLI